ncbi:hypothetical protein DLJ58_23365 [Micromonospora arida]|uniref:Low temperature requirement protein A n=1 Tax=Micromonospora arida TaxID=2203715 RepID=A0A3N9X1R9_9ACTN|nr:hypothetical protein DLJ58_23365 [Micromonospora arida]
MFVAALALTSQTLAQRLDWVVAFEAAVLLMAIWWVWAANASARVRRGRQGAMRSCRIAVSS